MRALLGPAHTESSWRLKAGAHVKDGLHARLWFPGALKERVSVSHMCTAHHLLVAIAPGATCGAEGRRCQTHQKRQSLAFALALRTPNQPTEAHCLRRTDTLPHGTQAWSRTPGKKPHQS